MGIRDLKKLIKKNAPGSLIKIELSTLSGTKVAIDSSILLYKYRYLYSSDDFHIIGFKNKIKELTSYEIVPVFIFDGKPPDAKQKVLKARSEKKENTINKIKELTQELPEGTFIQEFIDSDDESVNIKIKKINSLKKK